MKNTCLSELPFVPENFETDHYNKAGYDANHNSGRKSLDSLMTDAERRFVNGLLRYYCPERILEIGVALGGSTINILNAISDMPNAMLCSIDINSSGDCGKEAKNRYPESLGNKWHLFTGKDPADVISHIAKNGKIDFVIIDTAHFHPIESLNFLSVLPYLSDGAIVVLHDIAFIRQIWLGSEMAPRILFSCVVADKITLSYNSVSEPSYVNIGAFQISSDTRKYISNVFDALLLRWEFSPVTASSLHKQLEGVRGLISKHYSDDNFQKFDLALTHNQLYIDKEIREFFEKALGEGWAEKLTPKTVFYGAGNNMRHFLSCFKALEIPFNAQIWDINAPEVGDIENHEVKIPDFKTCVQNNLAIITITNESVEREVRSRLETLGYNVVHLSL